MVRALEGVTEKNHFGSDAFYAHKRIFATVWPEKKQVNLRLTPEQHLRFVAEDGEAFEAVANAFGSQGWTTVHLDFIERPALAVALGAAWTSSAAARPAAKPKTAPKKTATRKKKA